MQIATFVPHVPVTARNASQTPAQKPDSSASKDSVSLGNQRSFFNDTTLGRGLKNVAKGGLVAGGIPALGALGAQLGGAGILGSLAGTAALGAYLGSTIDMDSHSTLEKAAFGGALAGLGCMIGSVASQVGGLDAGLLVAGTFGAIGAFRGVLETAAENNWI